MLSVLFAFLAVIGLILLVVISACLIGIEGHLATLAAIASRRQPPVVRRATERNGMPDYEL